MPPRLSVVVPVYNVELYLTDCLKSLAEQTMDDLEVVMVDDGSTDGSAALATAFAEQDSRFRLVSQKNGGLGHARNTGVRNCDPASGYVAFVDSDDIVPPRAYELLVGALDETGSDIASGNVLRLRASGKLQQSPNFRKPMATTRLRTHISRDWDLAADRIACNKVFRRSFWDEHAFAFPVGTLYEDIPVVLPAHFLARSVDVVKDAVYHWRDRAGSITTRRAVVRGIRDRASHVLGVSTFLEQHRSAADKRRYEAHVLANDLWYFMEALPDGDDEYRRAFLTYANEFTDQVDPTVLDGLPLRLRLMWHLVRERRTGELLELLAHDKAEPGAFAVQGVRRHTASYPALTGPVPSSVLRVGDRDLPLTARLREAHWQGGKLHLKGYAYIRNLPAGSWHNEFRAGWLRAGRRHVVPLRLRTVDEPEATARSRQSLHDYDRSGFETVIDPARLRISADGNTERLTWRFEVGIAGHGMLRRSDVSTDVAAAAPPVHRPDGDHRIVPVFESGKLVVHAERIDARFETHRPGDAGDGTATVVISGMIRERLGKGPVRIGLTHRPSGTSLDFPATVHEGAVPSASGWRRFTAAIPLAAVTDARPTTEAAAVAYSLHLVGPDGRRTPVDVPGPVPPGRYPIGSPAPEAGGDEPRELALTASSRGNLLVSDRPVQPACELASWTEDGLLLLEGTFPADHDRPVDLVARHSGHHEEAVFPVVFSGPAQARRFRAELRPDAVEAPGGPLPLGEGHWYFFLRPKGSADDTGDMPLRIPAAAHRTLPAARTLAGRTYVIERRYHDQLLVNAASMLTPAERGARGKRLLREAYAGQRTAPCATPSCTAASTAASTPTRRARSTRNWPPVPPRSSICGSYAISRPGSPQAPPPSSTAPPPGTRRWPAAATSSPTPSCPNGSSGATARLSSRPGTAPRSSASASTSRARRRPMPPTSPPSSSAPASGASWSPRTASPPPSCGAPSAIGGRCSSAATPATTSSMPRTAPRWPPRYGSDWGSPRASGSCCTRRPGVRTSRRSVADTPSTSSSTWPPPNASSARTPCCWCGATTWSPTGSRTPAAASCGTSRATGTSAS